MACAVGDVMAEVKVRTSPGDDLRSLAVALTGARTGLGIVEVEGGGDHRAGRPACDRRRHRPRRGPGGRLETPDPVAVERTTPLGDACDLMIERGVRHLLVRDGGELVGVLNMRDVVGALSGAAELGAVPPARGS